MFEEGVVATGISKYIVAIPASNRVVTQATVKDIVIWRAYQDVIILPAVEFHRYQVGRIRGIQTIGVDRVIALTRLNNKRVAFLAYGIGHGEVGNRCAAGVLQLYTYRVDLAGSIFLLTGKHVLVSVVTAYQGNYICLAVAGTGINGHISDTGAGSVIDRDKVSTGAAVQGNSLEIGTGNGTQ